MVVEEKLEPRQMKSGISPMAPPELAPWLLCLPPMLYDIYQDPVPTFSKAPRGLSVQPRVTGIFTCSSNSPSLWSRQRPDRWTFRAGRNLPDKEFRYLRTVIVTAALRWGFSSGLIPIPLTFQ